MGRGKMGKGGKLSPEEKLEAMLADAKLKKDALEEQRKALLDELKTGIEKEIFEGKDDLQTELNIQGVCVKQLDETERKFRSYGRRMTQKKNDDYNQERWDLYMKCDRVPDVALVPGVHTFLYRWEIDDNAPFPENCKWRIKSSVELLEKLQSFIDEPLIDSPEFLANLIEAKERAREILKEQVDRTTFYALNEMESRMELKGLNTLQISMGNEYFNLCVWGIIPYPRTCFPIPKAQRPALVCDFEDIKMSVTMPDTLWGVPHAARLLQLNYDFLSDYCRVYLPLPLPEHLTTGLKTFVVKDWEKRLQLETIVDEERETRRIEITEIAETKLKTLKGGEATMKRYKEQLDTLRENIDTLKKFKVAPIIPAFQRLFEEEERLEEALCYELIPELRQGELNLRQYMLIGGIYCVEAVSQPPQPMELLSNYLMTTWFTFNDSFVLLWYSNDDSSVPVTYFLRALERVYAQTSLASSASAR